MLRNTKLQNIHICQAKLFSNTPTAYFFLSEKKRFKLLKLILFCFLLFKSKMIISSISTSQADTHSTQISVA